MSIMKLLQDAQGGEGLAQLANQFGLDGAQANKLTEMLAPALGSAAKQRAEKGGAADLLNAFRGQGQAGMFDDAGAAASDAGRAQGKNFLEQILGGQAQTENLANEAANRSGVDSNTVQDFLPALAAMVQGGMQKNMPDTSIDEMVSGLTGGAQGGQSGGGLMGMLGGLLGGKKQQAQASGGQEAGLGPLLQMLDADGDGSPMDDILEKIMR